MSSREVNGDLWSVCDDYCSANVALLVCGVCGVCVSLSCWYQTLGLSSASTGMFYNGAGDLVLHFIAHCNSQLTEILAEQHKQVQLGQAEYVRTHTHKYEKLLLYSLLFL